VIAHSAVLLIHSPDRKGLVARVSGLLYNYAANITHADQHLDRAERLFFMRVEWSLDGFELPAFRQDFSALALELEMQWSLECLTDRRPRVAILVSQHLHCLADILHRHDTGELCCDIPLIVSNHTVAEPLASFHRIPFHHVPIRPENRAEDEATQRRFLQIAGVDLVVLARYMQILTPAFVQEYPLRIINVHHSFLPAFIGARPYHAAFHRGVKLIGATSHYVTEQLDEGPIIEQDVARISHRDQVEDLVRKGRDLERVVLSRAVSWHLARRVLSYRNKTVIFD
jgi:formyltetrahydrofolate deformylase